MKIVSLTGSFHIKFISYVLRLFTKYLSYRKYLKKTNISCFEKVPFPVYNFRKTHETGNIMPLFYISGTPFYLHPALKLLPLPLFHFCSFVYAIHAMNFSVHPRSVAENLHLIWQQNASYLPGDQEHTASSRRIEKCL